MDKVEFVIPLPNVQIANLAMPHTLYESGDIKVDIKTLSDDEISNAFGYEIIRISSSRYSVQNTRQTFAMNHDSYVELLPHSPHQISIVCPSGDKANEIKQSVAFSLRCVVGISDRIAAVYTPDPSMKQGGWWSLWEQGGRTTTTKSLVIDQETTAKLASTIDALLDTNNQIQGMDNLKASLELAMQFIGSTDVNCALFFGLLESIFALPDERHYDVTYRLAARVTAKLHRGYDSFVKLKKLYSKRSDIVHGRRTRNSMVFNLEERTFVEELTTQAIFEYILSPSEFDSTNKLDRLLFSS